MIALLLQHRVLGAGAGPGLVASPVYQNVRASASGVSDASAVATFSMNRDGTWTAEGSGLAFRSGSWYLPTTAGIGDGYEVRITPTNTGGGGGVLTNDAAAWVPVSAARRLQLAVQRFTNGTTTASYSVLVEVRPIAGAVSSSGVFTLSSTATVGASGGGSGGSGGDEGPVSEL